MADKDFPNPISVTTSTSSDDNITILGNTLYNDDDDSIIVHDGSSWITTTSTPSMTITGSEISNTDVGTVTIRSETGQWDLEDRIKVIEKVIGIPSRDYDMEKKHPHLKEMFDDHIKKIGTILQSSEEYETECEKLRAWETLSNDGNV